MGDCYSRSTLQQFLGGKLSHHEYDEVQKHTDGCVHCNALLCDLSMRMEFNLVLPEKYQVERKLGAGSFGGVYLCHDTQLRRDVAIKCLHEPPKDDAWLSEAVIACKVRHENVAAIYSAENEPPHIVMEFVEGEDLWTSLQCEHIPVDEAATITKSIALGLSAIHEQGIVHRDLTLKNILRSSEGRIVITDFGLSVDLAQQKTEGLPPEGTLPFIAPEQIESGLANASFSSDIYSVGVILYVLLSRKIPFIDSTKSVVERIIDDLRHDQVLSLASVPTRLRRICLKAMSRYAGDRFDSAEELALAIESYKQYPINTHLIEYLGPSRISDETSM